MVYLSLEQFSWIIVELFKEDDEYIKIFGESLDLKILFKPESKILYELETFKKYDIGKFNMYYYNDKFYIEIIEIVKYDNYLKLLEDSKIIYGKNLSNVLNNMIKI